MIEEQGRIVAVEENAVWVETAPQSACGSCAVEKGCGQGVLAKYFQGRIGAVRAVTSDLYAVGDRVVIGVPDDVLLKGALLVYMLPLVAMLVFAGTVQSFGATEIGVILSGLAGFILGFVVVYYYSKNNENDERFNPVVLRKANGYVPQVINVS